MKLLIMSAIALTLAVPVAGAQGYRPPGTITVGPSTPAPGDEVRVTVTGCGPAPGQVDVMIDGVFVGRADVQADGSFAKDFVVPLESGGPVDVDVQCEDETLSSVLDVQIPDQPFKEGGNKLPRTGSDAAMLFAQAGAGLLGVGAMLLLVLRWQEDTAPQRVRVIGAGASTPSGSRAAVSAPSSAPVARATRARRQTPAATAAPRRARPSTTDATTTTTTRATRPARSAGGPHASRVRGLTASTPRPAVSGTAVSGTAVSGTAVAGMPKRARLGGQPHACASHAVAGDAGAVSCKHARSAGAADHIDRRGC